MRKRLRKKLRLAEFTEHAFGVRYTLQAGLGTGIVDEFLDRFIEHAIEANDLRCGGGSQDQHWEFLVTAVGRGSPTETQRGTIRSWLAAQPEVASFDLSGFIDAWHGPEDPPFENGRQA
jgi:uncharacterized protein YggL (DUF469 family)